MGEGVAHEVGVAGIHRDMHWQYSCGVAAAEEEI